MKADLLLRIHTRPLFAWSCIIALVVVALAQLCDWEDGLHLRLGVDPSIRTLLPQSGDELKRYEAIRERFDSDDLLLVAWVGDDVFTPEGLGALKRLTKRVERMPGVVDVESLATAVRTQVFDDYTDVSPYLSELPTTIAAARAIRDDAAANPLYAGYLVSADGRGAMLAARLDGTLSARKRIAIVADIAAASRAESGGWEQFLSGPLFVRLEISRLLLRDLLRVMPLAVAASLLIVAIGFRHWPGVVLPLLSNAVALVVTLAVFVATGHALNYVTVILPPTIYVVGFAYAIHVVCDFDRARQAGLERLAAVRVAVQEVVGPLTLTALTTAIGFASLASSSIDSIRVFGIFAALGTLLAWLAALTVVPLGLAHLSAAPVRVPSGRTDSAGIRLAAGARRHARAYVGIGAVLVVVSLAGAARITIDTDYLANFAQDSEVRSNFERLGSVFGGAVPLQVVIEGSEIDAVQSPQTLLAVAQLQHWLLRQPEVGAVYSFLDYVGVLEQALVPDQVDADPVPESAGMTSHLLLLGASEDVRRFADPEFTSTLLQVRVRVVASAELNALSDRITERLRRLPEGLDGYVTGSSYLIARTLDDVTRGQLLSLAAAVIPIFCVLAWMFRSLRLAAVALVPNVLPILAFFGILGWSGISLNLTTSLVASVVFGIAVDDSIHLFARLRAATRSAAPGEDPLAIALGAVVRPVSFTTAALALGFITLVAGELRSQAEFGLLAAVTLIIAWALDLTFAPALAQRAGMADSAVQSPEVACDQDVA